MDLEALRQNRKDHAAQLKSERRPIGILFMLLTLHLCLEFGYFIGHGNIGVMQDKRVGCTISADRN